MASFNGAYAIAMSLNFLTVWGVAQFDERAKLIEKYRAFLHAEPTIRDGAQAGAQASVRRDQAGTPDLYLSRWGGACFAGY